MQYCNHCQVQIKGDQEKCPLCQNILLDSGNMEDEITPIIPPSYEGHLAIKIMVFISILAIVSSFAIYQLLPSKTNWPIFVLFGVLSMWISLSVVIHKRHNIPKTIIWQITVVSMLSIFWDYKIGWRGWSLDYVLPIICVLAMLIMYITAKIMKLGVRDYIIYFLLDCIFGFVPIIFLLLGWVHVVYPSIICTAVSIIFISAIVIFQGDSIRVELNRRMHI